MADASTTKKAPRVVRTKIDPTKIKRPNCPVHTNSQMAFDAVSQKWRCPYPNCKLTAKPAIEANDHSLTLGTGAIQLRIVITPSGERAFVLVSDNNVALDITSLVDHSQVYDEFDVDSVVEAAQKAGAADATVTVSHNYTIRTNLYIIGVQNG